MIDWQLLYNSLPDLLHGAAYSLFIALASAIIGAVGGTGLALGASSSYWPVRFLANGYIHLIRGTPMLVQIMFLFYVAPQVGIWLSPLMAAITAMGMNSSAYLSQIIRVGFQSIDPLELQAARGLGLNRWQLLKELVIPQSLRAILPALGNESTTLLKDSSLASVVGVMELTKEGAIIRARTYDAFTSILAVALVYLLLTLLLAQLFRHLEKRGIKPCSW